MNNLSINSENNDWIKMGGAFGAGLAVAWAFNRLNPFKNKVATAEQINNAIFLVRNEGKTGEQPRLFIRLDEIGQIASQIILPKEGESPIEAAAMVIERIAPDNANARVIAEWLMRPSNAGYKIGCVDKLSKEDVGHISSSMTEAVVKAEFSSIAKELLDLSTHDMYNTIGILSKIVELADQIPVSQYKNYPGLSQVSAEARVKLSEIEKRCESKIQTSQEAARKTCEQIGVTPITEISSEDCFLETEIERIENADNNAENVEKYKTEILSLLKSAEIIDDKASDWDDKQFIGLPQESRKLAYKLDRAYKTLSSKVKPLNIPEVTHLSQFIAENAKTEAFEEKAFMEHAKHLSKLHEGLVLSGFRLTDQQLFNLVFPLFRKIDKYTDQMDNSESLSSELIYILRPLWLRLDAVINRDAVGKLMKVGSQRGFYNPMRETLNITKKG